MARGLLSSINEFLSYLQVERNLSPRSVAGYSHDLMKVTSFLLTKYGKEPLLNDITTADIRDFLAYMQIKRKVRSHTLSRKISCLRTFFAFLMMQKYLSSNPMDTIQTPKLAKKLPIYLTETELQRLLGMPNREKTSGKRDFAILMLFSYTGMRLSELTSLNLDSINESNKFLRVMGKGSKERMIPLILPVIEALNEYIDVRYMTEDKALFLSNRNTRITNRMVEFIVDKYRAMAGIPREKFSPHKLRHTFATLLHSKDVDILDIQALLGHSSIATTQIYTHTNPKRLQKAVEKLME